MSHPDHWNSLASELGAEAPAHHEAEKRPTPAPPPRRAPAPKKPAPAAGNTDWSQLANQLGLEPSPAPPEAGVERPAPRPSSPPVERRPQRESFAPPRHEPTRDFDDERHDHIEQAAEPAGDDTREAATSGGERSGDEERGGRKRRRRRRGGRRSKHDQTAGQATPHEGDEVTAEEPVRAHLESGDESDAAAGAPAEERERKGRPKRRRRRGSGRGREQKHAAEQAAEPAEHGDDDVASGDSLGEPHDDFANVMADDEAGDDDAGGDEIGDDDGGDSQLDKNSHRAIPAWEEAIGFIISINMESRAKNPKTSSPRGRGRGRGNRGGGRGNTHRRAN